MPLHYGSQLEEHHRVRRDAGMFDVSHMLVIDFTGAGVQRVSATAAGQRCRAPDAARARRFTHACLNDAGGVLDDLIVYRFGADFFRMVVNAGTADKDLRWISQQRDTIDSIRCTMQRAARSRHHRGSGARCEGAFLAGATGRAPGEQSLCGIPGGAIDVDGIELVDCAHRLYRRGRIRSDVARRSRRGLLWRDLLAQSCRTVRARRARYAAPRSGDESLRSGHGRERHAVRGRTALDRGSDDVARFHRARCARRRALSACSCSGLLLLDKGVLRAHQPVRSEHGDGTITSGTFSPTLGALDRAGAPARRCAPGRTRRGPDPRQVARRPRL